MNVSGIIWSHKNSWLATDAYRSHPLFLDLIIVRQLQHNREDALAKILRLHESRHSDERVACCGPHLMRQTE
jgi:hypothetical protein